MTPGKISSRVVTDRLNWVDRMVARIRALPLHGREEFISDSHYLWTAESCLRRAPEALLDLGRHVLAGGFGEGVSKYQEIARLLDEHGVLAARQAGLLRLMAGYRNRLVRFYHKIGAEELYRICANELGDVELVADTFRRWLSSHPQMLDQAL